jgi:hypothetical protein
LEQRNTKERERSWKVSFKYLYVYIDKNDKKLGWFFFLPAAGMGRRG